MRKVILLLLIVSFHLPAQQKTTTLVFVCEHGGARSTIASVYFNKLAKENHLPYRSVFRGLTPDSVITKETEAGLKADGFDTAPLKTTPLNQNELTSDMMLISLDCTAPSSYKTYENWKGIPAISEDYVAARNEIVKRLNNLIKELKANHP